MLQGQQDGLYRLRLVLREAVDYRKRPNHHPLWLGHYDRGTDHLIVCVREVHVERLDGRRYRVDQFETIMDAMAAKPVPRG